MVSALAILSKGASRPQSFALQDIVLVYMLYTAFWHMCRSFNSYIDYPTRGESYEIQHDDFHNTNRPNTFLAYGALVGGPSAEDT